MNQREAVELAAMHFRPMNRWVGDFIPFYWQNEYHLFYLPRAPEGRHCWGHLVSANLMDWQELPDALLPSNDPQSADGVGCWTGSVLHHAGTFHCFYTGFNPQNRFSQTICRAISDDLIVWRKDSGNPLLVPDERWYEPSDWRDPFVFFNEREGEFWMLICARDKKAPFERRGCVALATSPDLSRWTVREPLWSGRVCWACECPDLFFLQHRWFLIYSHGITRYRWADHLTGPWQTAFPDSLDSEFVAAAKTLFDGNRAILFGWVGTLEGEKDSGPRQWGGHMALPRELSPLQDGGLSVRLSSEWQNWHLQRSVPLQWAEAENRCGHWSLEDGWAKADDGGGVSVLKWDESPHFVLSAEVVAQGQGVEFGFLLRMTDGKGYKLVVDQSRIALIPWSSWGDGEPKWSRPAFWERGQPIPIFLVLHGSIIEFFLGDRISLTGRIYEPQKGWNALYAANGTVEFQNIRWAPLDPLR
ncbi:MAG: hypothetical protein NZ959_02500 [Armatimonadetes bacterium]|nr:hypothetical protein [Armatimonadota bacterium]MDW8120957.1 hypothetical protein [Armatimonadota bacterium]